MQLDTEVTQVYLPDPVAGTAVQALQCTSPAGLEAILVPDRALDIYSLRLDGTPISYTSTQAGISPANFVENGVDGFARNFFAGFLTTCGLIQSGRPCEENGRLFGLHGRISNTACRELRVHKSAQETRIEGIVEEKHDEGEHLRLARTICLPNGQPTLVIRDEIANLTDEPTPFMMMYHINFGAPFLSEQTLMSAHFWQLEDRDTGAPASEAEVTRIGAPDASAAEKVYYTRADLAKGVRLHNPVVGIACRVQAEGDGLEWLGVWKSYAPVAYALGVEPGNCPGLGRVNARRRGLLPVLQPGETRTHIVSVFFDRV